MAVKYIRERNAFYEWLTMNYLSPSAQACWNALFTVYNTKGWPEGWIEAPDMLLRSYMHVSNDTLLDARQQLKSKGLLEFVKGNRRAASARYRLIWFTEGEDGNTDSDEAEERDNAQSIPHSYPHSYPQIIHNDGFCPEISDKGADKGADKQADKGAGNVADKQADKGAGKTCSKPLIYKGFEDPYTILNYKQENSIENTVSERGKKQQHVLPTPKNARARDMTAKQKAYVNWYREIDSREDRIDEFGRLVASESYTSAQLHCAIGFTQSKVERGKVKNPLEYIKKLLIDWSRRNLTERADIEQSLYVDIDAPALSM